MALAMRFSTIASPMPSRDFLLRPFLEPPHPDDFPTLRWQEIENTRQGTQFLMGFCVQFR